jgi:hypothetical protein
MGGKSKQYLPCMAPVAVNRSTIGTTHPVRSKGISSRLDCPHEHQLWGGIHVGNAGLGFKMLYYCWPALPCDRHLLLNQIPLVVHCIVVFSSIQELLAHIQCDMLKPANTNTDMCQASSTQGTHLEHILTNASPSIS